jgi:hypothetical protein
MNGLFYFISDQSLNALMIFQFSRKADKITAKSRKA